MVKSPAKSRDTLRSENVYFRIKWLHHPKTWKKDDNLGTALTRSFQVEPLTSVPSVALALPSSSSRSSLSYQAAALASLVALTSVAFKLLWQFFQPHVVGLASRLSHSCLSHPSHLSHSWLFQLSNRRSYSSRSSRVFRRSDISRIFRTSRVKLSYSRLQYFRLSRIAHINCTRGSRIPLAHAFRVGHISRRSRLSTSRALQLSNSSCISRKSRLSTSRALQLSNSSCSTIGPASLVSQLSPLQRKSYFLTVAESLVATNLQLLQLSL